MKRQCRFFLQKLKFVDNPNESLPPPSKQIPNERFIQRIYQLVRKDASKDDFLLQEIDEYIKVSD